MKNSGNLHSTRWAICLLAPFALYNCILPPARAQSAPALPTVRMEPGTVVGHVRNEATNSFLANVSVRVVGTSTRALTDEEGGYSLTLPPGDYTLEYSYAGLKPMQLTVALANGQTVQKDVDLTSDIYKLDRFVVKGLIEENAAALQEQRYAPNPKTVIATNAYGAPTGNPGELLQRIPGISTNRTQGEITSIYVRGMNVGFAGLLVNGDPVAVSLGALVGSAGQYNIHELATANLSQVEFVKAPTPDMDANNIAGSINLIAKRSFDRGGREVVLNLSSSGVYRDWRGSPFDTKFRNIENISLSFADVYSVAGGKRNLGVTVDLAQSSDTRVSDEEGPVSVNSLSGAYTNYQTDNPLANTFALQEAGGKPRKRTAGINLDYKLGQDQYLYFKFSWTGMHRHIPALYAYVVPTLASDVSIFSPGSTYNDSTVLPGFATASVRSLNSSRVSATRQFSAGSSTKLWNGTATLDLRGNYSKAQSYNPYFVQAQANDPGVGFNLKRNTDDGAFFPTFTQVGGPDVTDPRSYILSTVNKVWTRGAPETIRGLRVDLKKYFETAVPTFIKLGVKWADDQRNDQRFYDSATFVGTSGVPNSPANTMAPYVGYQFRISKGKYGPFPFLPLVEDRTQIAPANQFTKTAAQAYNDITGFNARKTSIKQQMKSAYIEGHIDLGKLRILGGIRTEKTDDTSNAWIMNQTAAYGGNSVGGSSIDPVVVAANVERANRAFVGRQTGTNTRTSAFPGIHFIYEPLDGLLFRFSYNKGISRPDIASIIPSVSVDDVNQILTVGNPKLEPYFSDNFDLSVEQYYSRSGLVSVGVFRKEISNYYRTFTTVVGPEGYAGGGQYIGYQQRIALNVGGARIQGFEVSAQQQFSFLPGPLRGLGAFANFTYTQAEGTFGTLVNFGGLSISPRVPFLTPRTLNGGLSYVGYGLEAKVLVNYQSATYQGSSGVDYDAVGRTWVDLKLRYNFNPRYAVECNVSNLTNTYENKWMSSDGRLPFGVIKPGVAIAVGLVGKF